MRDCCLSLVWNLMFSKVSRVVTGLLLCVSLFRRLLPAISILSHGMIILGKIGIKTQQFNLAIRCLCVWLCLCWHRWLSLSLRNRSATESTTICNYAISSLRSCLLCYCLWMEQFLLCFWCVIDSSWHQNVTSSMGRYVATRLLTLVSLSSVSYLLFVPIIKGESFSKSLALRLNNLIRLFKNVFGCIPSIPRKVEKNWCPCLYFAMAVR